MIISIKVITNAKQNKIVDLDDSSFKIYLSCLAEKGKANQSIIKLLSKYFDVPKSYITITCGEKTHNKIIEVKKADS